jgi:hypothetical protein
MTEKMQMTSAVRVLEELEGPVMERERTEKMVPTEKLVLRALKVPRVGQVITRCPDREGPITTIGTARSN